jgi:hypothetical protein
MDIYNHPIAFMFHQDIANNDPWKILEMLEPYIKDTKYLIAYESKPYGHYHCLIDWDTKTYNAFVAKVLVKEMKLTGRAVAGKPRQYGRVLGIKKPDKMLAYTLKQGIYSTNIEESKLLPYKNMSYVKDSGDNDREIRTKLRDYIDNTYYASHFTKVQDEALKQAIIHFLLKEKIRIRTSSQIDGYFKYLRQFSNHDYIKQDCELYFYNLLFNSFI